MKSLHGKRSLLVSGAVILVAAVFAASYATGAGGALLGAAEVNPCAAKTINPCAAKTLNPCAAKTLNPCAAKTLNPCAAKTLNPCDARTLNPCKAKTLNPCDAKTLNPCAAKEAGGGNPCGIKRLSANPCGGASVDPKLVVQGSRKLAGNADLKLGKKLWDDRTLGKSGLACSSCHVDSYMLMNPTFKQPYPHRVEMPYEQAGLGEVNAAEMVQFCMVVPMASEPLAWSSAELASLAAFVESLQDGYRPTGGGAMNPCGGRP